MSAKDFLHFCDCFSNVIGYGKFPISLCMWWLHWLRLNSSCLPNSTFCHRKQEEKFLMKLELSTLAPIPHEIIYSNHQLIFGFGLISCRGSFLQDKLFHFICHKKETENCCHFMWGGVVVVPSLRFTLWIAYVLVLFTREKCINLSI